MLLNEKDILKNMTIRENDNSLIVFAERRIVVPEKRIILPDEMNEKEKELLETMNF